MAVGPGKSQCSLRGQGEMFAHLLGLTLGAPAPGWLQPCNNAINESLHQPPRNTSHLAKQIELGITQLKLDVVQLVCSGEGVFNKHLAMCYMSWGLS